MAEDWVCAPAEGVEDAAHYQVLRMQMVVEPTKDGLISVSKHTAIRVKYTR